MLLLRREDLLLLSGAGARLGGEGGVGRQPILVADGDGGG